MTGEELSIIQSITPEVIEAWVNIVTQTQSFLAQNGEIVIVIISALMNYMVKPLPIVKRRPRTLPFIAFFVSVAVFFLISDVWTYKSLAFGGLYLWAIVTINYIQDKSAVEKKLIDEIYKADKNI